MKGLIQKLKNLKRSKMFLPVLLIGSGILAIIMTLAAVRTTRIPIRSVVRITQDDIIANANIYLDNDTIDLFQLIIEENRGGLTLFVHDRTDGNPGCFMSITYRDRYMNLEYECQIFTTCNIKILYIRTTDYIDLITISTNKVEIATIHTGRGNDVVISLDTPIEAHLGDGDDECQGSSEKDKIYGNTGNDYLSGNGRSDFLSGGDGDDDLDGGNGNDICDGGRGNDYIFGRNGTDRLYGGVGNDKIYGGLNIDYIYGDSGNDYIDGGADEVDDRVFGGNGWDTAAIRESDRYNGIESRVVPLPESDIRAGIEYELL